MTRILVDVDEAAACFDVSVRTFQSLRDEPWMPRPIVLGPRLLRWSLTELQAAVAAMPRQAKVAEPAPLQRVRAELMRGKHGAPA